VKLGFIEDKDQGLLQFSLRRAPARLTGGRRIRQTER
jgi:hypothetical protein